MGSGNIKKFELKLGRTGLIIVIAGMAVLLCSSFILGVTVGKNIDTYPEKISSMPQRILAFFWRPAKIARQQNIIESKETSADKGNMDLAFYNALTGQKTPPIQQPKAVEKKPDDVVAMDRKVAQQTQPAIELPREEAASSKEEASEEMTPAGEKLPAEKKSKIKEIPTVVHPAGPLFFIHVASMQDKAKANQIHKTVSGLGYPSKVVKVDIKGKGTWYRVIATGFETKTRAQAAAEKINKKVKTNCIIRSVGQDANKNQ